VASQVAAGRTTTSVAAVSTNEQAGHEEDNQRLLEPAQLPDAGDVEVG
jgi:hypothetical protein